MSETSNYEPETRYRFRVMRTVKVAGVRLGCADEHEALGQFLNEIVAQEGEDVIDTAEPI